MMDIGYWVKVAGYRTSHPPLVANEASAPHTFSVRQFSQSQLGLTLARHFDMGAKFHTTSKGPSAAAENPIKTLELFCIHHHTTPIPQLTRRYGISDEVRHVLSGSVLLGISEFLSFFLSFFFFLQFGHSLLVLDFFH
jgi:hypothetical protein